VCADKAAVMAGDIRKFVVAPAPPATQDLEIWDEDFWTKTELNEVRAMQKGYYYFFFIALLQKRMTLLRKRLTAHNVTCAGPVFLNGALMRTSVSMKKQIKLIVILKENEPLPRPE
jgi:hypothetical protein